MSANSYFVRSKRSYTKKIINYQSVKDDYYCQCFVDKYNLAKQGYNDPTQTNNMRISQMLTNNLNGRIVFGDRGVARAINYLGGIEGQPGGMPRILRNKF